MQPTVPTRFASAVGLALGQAHWDLAIDPDSADVVDHNACRNDPGGRDLPVTDIEFHVTGRRGAPPHALRELLALLRLLDDSGRDRPTPVEQDYVTGYLRHLLSASPCDDVRERLHAILDRLHRNGPAVRTALEAAWAAVGNT